MTGQAADPRAETEAQRDDRNLAELLQEVRIAGLGVQVLFGFLLAIPFTTRFVRLDTAQRDLYLTALLLAALSTGLLLSPVAYHRVVFRRRQKESLVRTANVLAILGLVAVGLSITASVALVLSYVAPGLGTVLITIVVGLAFTGLWFVLPLLRRDGGGKLD
jgi:predicted membrane channel-forming protein YqfA (hemolysin III family)